MIRSRSALTFVWLLLLAGCATLPPPGSDYPKTTSTALAHPEETRLGRQLQARAREHPGLSGFRLLTQGGDGFLVRAEMASAAERTLDIQYFIIQNDETGKLLLDRTLRAADRGVRVRLLLDDTGTSGGDRDVALLAAHPNIEIRLFNPFRFRGELDVLRKAEFALDGQRLNYRMHNKLFIADNAMAIVGGRNIGDEYFQASRQTEFGDFDVIAVGPVVKELSESFDAYWNSPLAIPGEALTGGKLSGDALDKYRATLADARDHVDGAVAMKRLAANDPLSALLSGKAPLSWARADVIVDNPEKAKVQAGEKSGELMRRPLAQAVREAKSELIIVSPYVVPGEGGMKLLKSVRERGVRVRVLTNSFASTDIPIVHAGYGRYRVPMLEDGIELYEVRPVPGQPQQRSETLKSPSSGQFALHAKVFVFDRRRVFVGSMNFDRRSLRLNTELGLIIDSPELARQAAERFEAIAKPANSYALSLGQPDVSGRRTLTWRTEEGGRMVDYDTEPNPNKLRQLPVELMSVLPIEGLL